MTGFGAEVERTLVGGADDTRENLVGVGAPWRPITTREFALSDRAANGVLRASWVASTRESHNGLARIETRFSAVGRETPGSDRDIF
jgi:hypothetical protein